MDRVECPKGTKKRENLQPPHPASLPPLPPPLLRRRPDLLLHGRRRLLLLLFLVLVVLVVLLGVLLLVHYHLGDAGGHQARGEVAQSEQSDDAS